MNKLVFLDWTGPKRTFEFVGWNSGRAASSFLDSTAFVLDDADRRQALELRLPFLNPVSYQPFPRLPPTRIEKFRIEPPPCRPQQPAKWETGEFLYPEQQDEPEFEAALKLYLKDQLTIYEERRADAAKLEGEEKIAQEQLLEVIYNGPPLGILNTTLADVKLRNVGGIRDGVLQRRWAKANGFDLADMAQDKQMFINWAEQAEVVADASLVFYRINFSDGGRFWLSTCQLRDLLTVEETLEFDKLLAARLTGSTPFTRGWTNEDYSMVRLPRANGVPCEFGIPPALGYLLQALDEADGRTLASPELTERIMKLRKAKGAEVSQADYRPHQTLRSKEAKILLDSGVLVQTKPITDWVFKLIPPGT